jgi:hypothetical protein
VKKLACLIAAAVFAATGFSSAARAAGDPILVFPFVADKHLKLNAEEAKLHDQLVERLEQTYGDRVLTMAAPLDGKYAQDAAYAGAGLYLVGKIEKVKNGLLTVVSAYDPFGELNVSRSAALPANGDLPEDITAASLVEPAELFPPVTHKLGLLPIVPPDQTNGASPAAAASPAAGLPAAPPAPHFNLTGQHKPKSDTVLAYGQYELRKKLRAQGIATAVLPAMDPIDARLEAKDVCNSNAVDGLLLGAATHSQERKDGNVRKLLGLGALALPGMRVTGIPLAGAAAGGATAGATNLMAFDDKYISHATITMLLADCGGKRRWTGQTTVDTIEDARNRSAGETSAIDSAADQIVAAIDTSGLTTPSPAPSATPPPRTAEGALLLTPVPAPAQR